MLMAVMAKETQLMLEVTKLNGGWNEHSKPNHSRSIISSGCDINCAVCGIDFFSQKQLRDLLIQVQVSERNRKILHHYYWCNIRWPSCF
ncbi:hypothetical protein QWZ16_24845 [Vibrio ostreicida]|uniref:Uncharacterized protein n=1 Tax=Vibrio ostreicida TaxID=526588 RepID=A0ABT8C283_9VIBR|nr:hypothetical protein [Vibrio ostreicida]MDN3612779.1 hypothetical protein [Vibrio ostreicida]